jgi:hypothetical protein
VVFICEETKGIQIRNSDTLDEFQQSVCDTVISVEVNELKLVSYNLFERFEMCLRADGRHCASSVMVRSLKQCVYFKKCMCGILTANLYSIFSAGDS